MIGAAISVGASVANNTIENTVHAGISGTEVTGGRIDLDALSSATIESVAGAASISASVGVLSLGASGGGASSTNRVASKIEAFINNGAIVRATGPLTQGFVDLAATDTSSTSADVVAVSVTFSGTAGGSVGVSIADNVVENTVQAFIGNSEASDTSSVTSDNDIITLDAASTADVDSSAVATSVAVSTVGLAGAGGESDVDIRSNVAAFTGSGTTLSAKAAIFCSRPNRTTTMLMSRPSVSVSACWPRLGALSRMRPLPAVPAPMSAAM